MSVSGQESDGAVAKGTGRGVRVATVASGKQHHLKEHRAYKVIVIGSSGVGKTCFTCLFADGACSHRPEATIGVDFRERKVIVEKEIVKMQIWDTAGQERFRRSMTSRYYRDAHAMVVMYDITNMQSFRQCQSWLEEARQSTDAGVRVCALVGNKCDEDEKRVVSTRMGSMFAEANDMLFFETSTRADNAKDLIKHVFFTIAVRLTERRARFEESVHVRADDLNFSLLPESDGTYSKKPFSRSQSMKSSHSLGRSSSRDVVHIGEAPPENDGKCCKSG